MQYNNICNNHTIDERQITVILSQSSKQFIAAYVFKSNAVSDCKRVYVTYCSPEKKSRRGLFSMTFVKAVALHSPTVDRIPLVFLHAFVSISPVIQLTMPINRKTI